MKAVSLLFGILQVVILAVNISHPQGRNALHIIADTLSIFVAIAICCLSFLEHSRSPRPSFLLDIYLLACLVLDCAKLRSLWRIEATTSGVLLSVSAAIKLVLLTLETVEKRQALYTKDEKLGPEKTAGLLNRSIFWWLVGLLKFGFREVLGGAKSVSSDRQDALVRSISQVPEIME